MAKRRVILGIFEYEVLRTLSANPEQGYGMAIAAVMSGKRTIAVGAVSTTLLRLEAKGLVGSTWDEPRATRGGRRRRMFHVNDAGRIAMRLTQDMFQSA